MNTSHDHPDSLLLELLADRALQGLSPDEDATLARLLSDTEPDFDAEALDRAAAALSVALIPDETESLPASLRHRLDDDASRWNAQPPARTATIRTVTPRPFTHRAAPNPLARLGWLAAAACLLLAALAWVTRPGAPNTLSPDQQRQALLDAAPDDLVQIVWTATDDPAAQGAVEGQVVWSDARNEGYMTFTGLAANNPNDNQYQLWIFDAQRDERYPIDGGVFDIPADNRPTTVRIDPRLPVTKATLFAITVEKPGGVVVSTRERLPVLAKVEG